MKPTSSDRSQSPHAPTGSLTYTAFDLPKTIEQTAGPPSPAEMAPYARWALVPTTTFDTNRGLDATDSNPTSDSSRVRSSRMYPL